MNRIEDRPLGSIGVIQSVNIHSHAKFRNAPYPGHSWSPPSANFSRTILCRYSLATRGLLRQADPMSFGRRSPATEAWLTNSANPFSARLPHLGRPEAFDL